MQVNDYVEITINNLTDKMLVTEISKGQANVEILFSGYRSNTGNGMRKLYTAYSGNTTFYDIVDLTPSPLTTAEFEFAFKHKLLKV